LNFESTIDLEEGIRKLVAWRKAAQSADVVAAPPSTSDSTPVPGTYRASQLYLKPEPETKSTPRTTK
jgi:hypothetical protein